MSRMLPQSRGSETELSDLLEVVWRRKWIILACALLVAAAAVVLTSRQTDRYEATTSVLLRGSETSSIVGPGDASPQEANRDLANELAFIQSDQIRAAIVDRLGGASRFSARTQEGSDVISFRAEGTIPARVAEMANVAAEVYIEERTNRVLQDYVNTAAAVQQQIDATVEEREALVAPVEEFRASLDPNLTDVFGVPVNSDAQIATYNAELDRLETGISSELQRLQAFETTLNNTLGQLVLGNELGGTAQIIKAARVPTAPFSPNVTQNTLVGVVGGLLLGLALAFLIEYFDHRVRTVDDVRSLTDRVVLAAIPHKRSFRPRRQAPFLPVLDDPGSAAAEAYRSLWSSIEFQSQTKTLRRILVTSASDQEGKSTVAANLALTLAKAGRRVVLVDGDLRRPRIHEIFDLENDTGFANLSGASDPASNAFKTLRDVPNLSILTSGEVPGAAAEFLASLATTSLLDALGKRCDYLIIDSSPLLPVTDPLILAGNVDGVLFVCRAGVTSEQNLRTALDLVEGRASVFGIVLNSIRSRKQESSYYHQGSPKDVVEVVGDDIAAATNSPRLLARRRSARG